MNLGGAVIISLHAISLFCSTCRRQHGRWNRSRQVRQEEMGCIGKDSKDMMIVVEFCEARYAVRGRCYGQDRMGWRGTDGNVSVRLSRRTACKFQVLCACHFASHLVLLCFHRGLIPRVLCNEV